jgi:hypothetical protein|tara:strand:- start:2492 stop:2695 length:204 start_codon:yes stop_codon:yes gene_type:complete
MNEVIGMDSAYKEALEKPSQNMTISTNLVREIIENYSEMQNAIIDLKASLRTCQNTSNAVLDQYKYL